MLHADFLLVGAGFAGSVCARALADAGKRVHVVERRHHVGGNAADRVDAHGVLVHPYGPHIFHTNSKTVFDHLSRFTEWRFYEHRVLAQVGRDLVPIPINRTTVNRLYGLNLSEEGVRAFLDSVRQPSRPIRSSEDVVLQAVGEDLCNKFFRGYTRKQWGLDLSELSPSVVARIPTRTSDDDRYFGDAFQFMPKQGYTRLFERMLEHPLISVELGCDFRDVRGKFSAAHLIYTGPIDAYFERCFGPLPYRSLDFEHVHLAETARYQPAPTVNYPNDYDYTRVTEFKHLTGQEHTSTSIVREYPKATGEPYYPIPRPENEALYQRYRELAAKEHGVTFVGRLAQYRYYNMDQVVAAALKVAEDLLESGARR